MKSILKKYWFVIGLLGITGITLADFTGGLTSVGSWCKANYGPQILIFIIFILSGMMLDIHRIRNGITDYKGIITAFVLIFGVAPALAALVWLVPLDQGIRIGLFLVAVMPTTLSSGVVMTGIAGGNMAHALLITVLTNGFCVVTIPFTLTLLLANSEHLGAIVIEPFSIMAKLVGLVIVPLAIGLGIKWYGIRRNWKAGFMGPGLNIVNQCFILTLVWMALSQSREAILEGGNQMAQILVMVTVFHGLMLGAGWLGVRFMGLGRGRMESVLFMGVQKTLTLSIILQVSLFPQYGMALVVCVVHHIVHLLMDGWLAENMKSSSPLLEGRCQTTKL